VDCLRHLKLHAKVVQVTDASLVNPRQDLLQITICIKKLLLRQCDTPLSVGEGVQTVILIYVELSLVHVPTFEFHEFGTGRSLAILHQDGLMEVLPEEPELQLELCLPELVQVPTYRDWVHLH
jgi:hypothetical protein